MRPGIQLGGLLVLERHIPVLWKRAVNGLGVKRLVPSNKLRRHRGCRYPHQKVVEVVIEIRAVHRRHVLHQPVRDERQLAPDAVPEVERLDRVGRIDVPIELGAKPLDRCLARERGERLRPKYAL